MIDEQLSEEYEKAKVQWAINKLKQGEQLREHLSLLFGGGTTDLVTEDPVNDDDDGIWTEVGLTGDHRSAFGPGVRRPFNEPDLFRARSIGRRLAVDNGFAQSAIEARVSYIIGTGLAWRAVPKDDENVPKEKTKEVNDAIKAFAKANKFTMVEQEFVSRVDRDGEAFVRTFPNNSRPLDIRFTEPEDIKSPTNDDRTNLFGVQVSPDDVQRVLGYWILPGGAIAEGQRAGRSIVPTLVPIMHGKGDLALPQILHFKANVDLNSRRGWPTLWAVRRNFFRAEKLLRNMSFVAALQAGIAMIRKHDNATLSQVESFLDQNADLLVQNRVTGRETRFTKLLPGTVFDVGPGTSYEAPVSSVNAEQNVGILQADLREIAAALQMPEFMLTANAQNANLAGILVAEGPATKGFERLQQSRGQFLQEIVEAGLLHDVKRGKLSAALVDAHDIVATFPTVISRNKLNEAQRFEIEARNKIVSRKTWRGIAGYDNDTEETNLEEERKEAMKLMPQLLPPGDADTDTNTGHEDEDGNTGHNSDHRVPPPNPKPGKRDDDEEVGVPRKS